MPYAPAVRVESPCGLLFISGATPSPPYHKHPHVISEHDHPNRTEDQTRRAMETIKTILEHEGLTWTDVVKVTKYLTDIDDQGGMVAVVCTENFVGVDDVTKSPKLAGWTSLFRAGHPRLAIQVKVAA